MGDDESPHKENCARPTCHPTINLGSVGYLLEKISKTTEESLGVSMEPFQTVPTRTRK
jgi:hypothetical protein